MLAKTQASTPTAASTRPAAAANNSTDADTFDSDVNKAGGEGERELM